MTGFVSENACCQKKDAAGLLFMHEGVEVLYFPQPQLSIQPVSALQEVQISPLAHDKVNSRVGGKGAVFHDYVAAAPVCLSHEIL